MSDTPQKPDDFQKPKTFISPSVQNILHDQAFVEECLLFSYYKGIEPGE